MSGSLIRGLGAIICMLAGAGPAFPGWPQPVIVPGAHGSGSVVVMIGGLQGEDSAVASIERAVAEYKRTPAERRSFTLYAVPRANPEAEKLVFPPAGTAYRENAQSHYLWRWLGLRAPDLVIVAGEDRSGLTEALTHHTVAGVGSIPAIHVEVGPASLLKAVPKIIVMSEARRAMVRRLARTKRRVAEELSGFYGHDFEQAVYIPAMALIGRARLGQQAEVASLLAPYAEGKRDSLEKATASHLAGHLVFAEMAERTGDRRYVDRVRAAAGLAFTDAGEMKDAMPMHSEMSDAVFMGCPILAAAGKLTGEARYFDMAVRHLRFMQQLCRRPDGLYRHSPLDEAAWGRGNGFPALGLSWTLLYLPADHARVPDLLRDFRAHMAALAKFQDSDGMWHEVIDDAGSYPEFSSTAMIATAMFRGVAHGWLDRTYADRALAAWRGVLARIGDDGSLVDVCESTGKQKSKEDYLKRAASLGKDARGGGMALLLATEKWE